MMIIPYLTQGKNTFGQLGNGTTDDNSTLVVMTSNQMQPKSLTLGVINNGSDGSVAVSGDFNATISAYL